MYLLKLLKEESLYGNQIIDAISKKLSGKWKPSPGMIYPMLRKLEKSEYIIGKWAQPDRRSVKRYRLTNKGLKYLNQLLVNNKELIDESICILNTVKNDLYEN